MLRKFVLILLMCILFIASSEISHAITSIDTNFVNRNVVFFFEADAAGHVMKDKHFATGFLLTVPSRSSSTGYNFLVTARHVVDQVWSGCAAQNRSRLFLRINKMRFDPKTDESGVDYLPIDLVQNGNPTWQNSDENVDVAVLKAPSELLSGNYDVRFLNYRNFGKPEELAKLGVGSQTATSGLVPELEGQKRNNPIFHFGKIASIPDEPFPFRCTQHSAVRPLRVWWIATTLVPGTSGSPIYFDPLFPPGADISAGEPRAMLIGLQSLSVAGADLAGMTPAKNIMEEISHAVPPDADLALGLPSK
jgi:hypothetical protein